TWTQTRDVASNRDGSVTMSPAAVTSGAATLSMSQSRRADTWATPTVSPSTTIDEIAPPTTEITTNAPMEMVWSRPKPTATALASTARARETDRLRAVAARTFWPTTVSARADTRNVPVRMGVPRRLP